MTTPNTNERDRLAEEYASTKQSYCELHDAQLWAREGFKAGWDAREPEVQELKRQLGRATHCSEGAENELAAERQRSRDLEAKLEEERRSRDQLVEALEWISKYPFKTYGAQVAAEQALSEYRGGNVADKCDYCGEKLPCLNRCDIDMDPSR
jgi:hypothetical protein